jgi:3-methyladenine DNA glycosylase AlkC
LQEAINILSKYKTDESEYVRKSIGNALKDISKKHPELIKKKLKKWELDSKEITQVYKLANKLMEN